MTCYSYIISSSQDLEHHGILGMKWGVRRYQNKDGSLTSAGKRHYTDSDQDSRINSRLLNRGNSDSDLYKRANERAKDSVHLSRKQKKADEKRTQLADRAAREARFAKTTGEDLSKTAEALKKEGEKGKTMREIYGNEIDDEKYFKDLYGYSVKDAWKSEIDDAEGKVKMYGEELYTV